MGGGAFAWYVQTWNPAGYGPWSNNTQPTNFTTTVPTQPPAAVLIEPKGDIGSNYTPTYKWDKVTTATWYRLYVSGPTEPLCSINGIRRRRFVTLPSARW